MAHTDKTTIALEEMIQRHGPDEIQVYLDQTLEDVITLAEMDKKTKSQLKVLFAMKRIVRVKVCSSHG